MKPPKTPWPTAALHMKSGKRRTPISGLVGLSRKKWTGRAKTGPGVQLWQPKVDRARAKARVRAKARARVRARARARAQTMPIRLRLQAFV